MKRLNSDRVFTAFNYVLASLFLLVALYPIWYIVICSFSSTAAITAGEVWIIPRKVTLIGYKIMFEESEVWVGYANTIGYTILGTCVNLLCTVPAAYALSRETLPFRRQINFYFMITMFIGAGLVPTYLLVSKMGLTNTRLVIVLLGAVSVWNMIICRTFFQTSIPIELIDAARIDGSSELGIFIRIVLPLSKPVLAVMVLYFAVGHWNSYYNAMVYLRDASKYPLQLVLRTLLLSSTMVTEDFDRNMWNDRLLILQTMKYGVMIVSSLPVFIMYPFVQKYFVKGVMIGAVKG